jgi:hypothetical protein
MSFDGCFGAGDGGVAEGYDFVLGRGLEVGEMGEDGPRHSRGETDETYADGCHVEVLVLQCCTLEGDFGMMLKGIGVKDG